MKRRSNHLFLYLLLNLLVSAGATLGVLWAWDRFRPRAPQEVLGVAILTQEAPTATPGAPASPTPTPLPPDEKVIEIVSVVGAGDLQQEVLRLRRMGEGDLQMTGWKLTNGRGDQYEFPASPSLILFKGGAVQVFSAPGTDTATDVYWNRSNPAWQSGDTAVLYDPQGIERARYVIP